MFVKHAIHIAVHLTRFTVAVDSVSAKGAHTNTTAGILLAG